MTATSPDPGGGQPEPGRDLQALGRADPGLANSLTNIQRALGDRGPTDLSEQAVAKVLDLQAEYLEDLIVGAAGEARRSRADTISESDVETADATLRVPRASLRSRAGSAIGGLLAGAGLGQFYAVISADNPTPLGYAVAFVSTVLGSVLITLYSRR